MIIDWIAAEDIDAWATKESRRAQELLPELIARLIYATSNKIQNINFTSIEASGFDGELEVAEQTNYFPQGKSVWELGTDKDSHGKFRGDIKKRTEDSLGVEVSETVFMFATLKKWTHQNNTISKTICTAKKEYGWKDIRILDAQELARWLESCPSVFIWFAKIMGKHIPNVFSAEQFWEDHSGSTNPRLTPDCLLIGREWQSERLSKWLRAPSEYITIKAESSLEAALFTLASVLNMSDVDKDKILNRLIIVTKIESWEDVITRTAKQSILIPLFPIMEMVCPRDRCVVFPVSKFDSIGKLGEQDKCLNLQKYNRTQFDKLLELLAYDSSEHGSITFETKRSFLPLYRKISTNPTRKQPKWTNRGNLRELLPAMFVCGWNANCEGDKDVVETLSGMDYKQYMRTITEWANMEDAPIVIFNSNYYVVSIDDTWDLLYSLITSTDVASLKECLTKVLNEISPVYELPEEQRFYANMLGKTHKYSNTLTNGIILTLLMFSKRDSYSNSFNISSTKIWVDSVLKDILGNINTWQHWNTISASLPLIAEVSPTVILDILHKEVTNKNSEFWHMFIPPKDRFWGQNYYTHVLWALERLVWNEDSVVCAIRLLALIGEKSIEYKLTNTPNNSLYNILCLWHPQNCLNTEDRIEIVSTIVSACPNTGWSLLKSLMPKKHATSGQILRPRWRNYTDPYSSGLLMSEYDHSAKKLLELCLNCASGSKDKWIDIIDGIHQFDIYELFDELTEKLQETCAHLTESETVEICNKLRDEISNHRKYGWNVPAEDVDKWEILLHSITPNTIGAYSYLLKAYPDVLNPIPYDKEKRTDFDREREEISSLRKAAFDEIINNYGEDAFFQFCAGAEPTHSIDWEQFIVEYLLKYRYDFVKLHKIRVLNPRMYSNILYLLYSRNGLTALLSAVTKESELTLDDIGEILCCTDLSMDVWTELEKLDASIMKYYWDNARVFGLKEDGDMDYCIDKLLDYKRPFTAVELISYSEYKNPQFIMKVLWNALELNNHIESSGISFRSIQNHAYLNLFEKLYSNFNVDDMEVARLEFAYMPIFGFDGKPECLIRCITKNPVLFIDLISKAYINDTQDSVDVEKHIIRMSLDALGLFNVIPGCSEDLIDCDIFNNWVQEARRLAVERGYVNAFESRIGKLLAHSPNGSDGLFPHEMIRDYFEHNFSESLIDSFICEKINKRGTYTVTGGVAEKQIAERYSANSKALQMKHPNMATVLDKLSQHYLYDSKHEQIREEGDLGRIY